jgi:hypothetical protein
MSMAKYKVLKSVAHNIGHSFTSLMNYAGDDYAMGHILRFARRSGRDTLTIDFVTGEGGPAELLAEPIAEIPARYSQFFWDLIQRHGSDRSLVKNATLTLRYDIARKRSLYRDAEVFESPYICDVRVTDTRGKDYVAHFESWWYPELREEPIKELNLWWKFWVRPRTGKK